MSLRGNTHGIAGPFEDIPSLLIVTIGLGIFLLSLVSTYATYAATIESSHRYSECYEISRAIKGYDQLIVNGSYTAQPTEGRFDYNKLSEITSAQIKNEIVSKYKFNIVVTLYSGLDRNGKTITEEEWQFCDTVPDDSSIPRSILSTTILIKINESIYKLGQLRVTTWQ